MQIITGQPADGPQGAASASIIDVSVDTFEKEVIEASLKQPVIVDFWAPWCGPCKQMMPALEKAVNATGGAVRLAKVNIDENPQLAQALRIQSVPTIYAFFQGQPVDGFMGAQPESELKKFVDKLSGLAGEGRETSENIDALLEEANKTLDSGDAETAMGLFARVLEADAENAAGFAGMAKALLASGDAESAAALLGPDNLPESVVDDPAIGAARKALELAQKTAGGDSDLEALKAAVENNADDHQARFDLAMALYGAGEEDAAMDALIEIIRRDHGNETKWEDDKARTQLFEFFDALGPAHPATAAGRRKLSTILFS